MLNIIELMDIIELENKVKLGFYVVVFILGFFGNLFVIIIVVVRWYCWIVNDIFIFNLVISDFVYLFVCFFMNIYMMFVDI